MSLFHLQGVGLEYPHRVCFHSVDLHIVAGQRIALVGDNGSGKSSFLKLLSGALSPSAGQLRRQTHLQIGYLPQVIEPVPGLSGGQAMQQRLSDVLQMQPDVLLLDEPSNHLDMAARKALKRMLQAYGGTLLIVSHDIELLHGLCDTLYCLQDGQLQVFQGELEDWLQHQAAERDRVQAALDAIVLEQQQAHQQLMREQQRASKARQHGNKQIEERRWATIKSPAKLGRSNTTAGQRQTGLRDKREALLAQRAALPRFEEIQPSFQLSAAGRGNRHVLQIAAGVLGYTPAAPVLTGIQLQLEAKERIWLTGPNGSGKSTLLRALRGDVSLHREGDWLLPPPAEVAYLDQHYADLQPSLTVLACLQDRAPGWSMQQLRRHLSDFLFRHEAQVNCTVERLSGGERARLALACLAARPPRLLLLDEPSNNLDWTLKRHLLSVLQAWPASLLVVSHDVAFMQKLRIDRQLSVEAWHAWSQFG